MNATPAPDTPPVEAPAAPRWKQWLVLSPLARIVIFVVVMGAMIFLLRILFVTIGWAGQAAPAAERYTGMLVMQLVPALGAYLVLVYAIEGRHPGELAWRKVVPHGVLGFLAGGLLISAVVGVLWFLGSYQVTGYNADPPWAQQLLIGGLGAAVAEEIITRGVLFRITEEGLGTWGALMLSAAVFGFGHIFNPGATVWSSAAIAVEAGLLFGLLFHVTRSLPLCMGAHMGWNFTQGTVWGIPVSGGSDTGWLVSDRPGPDWLSGGVFGAEASVVTVGICSAVTLVLLVLAVRRGTIVPPWFAGGRITAASPAPADNDIGKATPSC